MSVGRKDLLAREQNSTGKHTEKIASDAADSAFPGLHSASDFHIPEELAPLTVPPLSSNASSKKNSNHSGNLNETILRIPEPTVSRRMGKMVSLQANYRCEISSINYLQKNIVKRFQNKALTIQ